MTVSTFLAALGHYVGIASGILAVYGAVVSTFSWIKTRDIRAEQVAEQERRGQSIELVLEDCDSGACLELPARPRRDQCTRSEILGILGTMRGEKRLDTAVLSKVFWSGEYSDMLEGRTNTLRCKVTPEDYAEIKRVIDKWK
jgi:hypothetical protein